MLLLSAILIIVIGIVCLACGYIFYGGWLAKVWGVDPQRKTPAITVDDNVDYVAAKPEVLTGHHFSSIAGAGPISGPIQAAVFGWVPVFLWVVIGGIFFGGVHDFGALLASVRHGGQSIGTVIEKNIGMRAKRLFLVFSYLVLLLVVAAFTSIVAKTFGATYTDGVLDKAASFYSASAAMISVLFIAVAMGFGYFVYRKNASVLVSTLIGVAVLVGVIIFGLKVQLYLPADTWMWVLGIYIFIASVAPVWILLQPRDYLSSFLLYAMILASVVGIFGAHPVIEMPAFTGWTDPISSLGSMFPALFITVACGAISGFHSLVASGTTAKQLSNEKYAKPIGYGSMLIECLLALIALIAVGSIWSQFADRSVTVPTTVLATGVSTMLGSIFGDGIYTVTFALIILAVSAFCLTSLDTATRLARYMFTELFLKDGEASWKEAKGIRKILANPYIATLITVVIGVWLGKSGYAKIWPLFGAANQLLAGLALLAVAAWLGNIGKKNKLFFIPMAFMIIVTLTSLIMTVIAKLNAIAAGGADIAVWLQLVFGALLVILAIFLVIEGVQTLVKQKKAA